MVLDYTVNMYLSQLYFIHSLLFKLEIWLYFECSFLMQAAILIYSINKWNKWMNDGAGPSFPLEIGPINHHLDYVNQGIYQARHMVPIILGNTN